MKCPVCKEAMLVFEWERVELDHCPSCKGVWLDSGELEVLLEGSHEKNKLLVSFQKCDQRSGARKCPICLKKMEEVFCGTGERVRLDRCIQNHGLWFDLGELDQILRMSFLKEYPQISSWLKSIFVKA